jgi:hypothetical protein
VKVTGDFGILGTYLEEEQLMSTFTAGVQYGDWSGTVAADDTDHGSGKRIEDFVKKEDDEFLLAAQLYVGEPHDKSLAEPYIHAYLLKGVENYEEAEAKLEELKADGEPIPVREVTIRISLKEFLALFKRFSVVLTWRGLPLKDREYDVTEKSED